MDRTELALERDGAAPLPSAIAGALADAESPPRIGLAWTGCVARTSLTYYSSLRPFGRSSHKGRGLTEENRFKNLSISSSSYSSRSWISDRPSSSFGAIELVRVSVDGPAPNSWVGVRARSSEPASELQSSSEDRAEDETCGEGGATEADPLGRGGREGAGWTTWLAGGRWAGDTLGLESMEDGLTGDSCK